MFLSGSKNQLGEGNDVLSILSVVERIVYIHIHIRVWYYFIMWEGYNCRATSGPMSV